MDAHPRTTRAAFQRMRPRDRCVADGGFGFDTPGPAHPPAKREVLYGLRSEPQRGFKERYIGR